MAVVHLADARHDGGEGAHDRDELGQGHGLAAVALEERRRAIDVLLLEQPGVGPVEDRRPRLAADRIARLVADDRGQPYERGGHPDVDADGARAHEHAECEQQRVPRQEEADEQAGLGEDHEHDAHNRPGAEPLHDRGDNAGGVEPFGAQGRGEGPGEVRGQGCGESGRHGRGKRHHWARLGKPLGSAP